MTTNLADHISKNYSAPYDYYIAGRTLCINAQLNLAAFNFSYCIELMIKWILEHKGYTELQKSHNFCELFKQLNLCDVTINISDDFILFINTRFNIRYPSNRNRKTKEYQDNNLFFGMTIDYIHAYDDIILQLDDYITQNILSSEQSFLNRALNDLDAANSRILLHCNRSAFRKLHKSEENFIQKYWKFDNLPLGIPYSYKNNTQYAGDFKIPHWIEGDPPCLNLKHQVWQSFEKNFYEGFYYTLVEITLEEGTYKYENNQTVSINE